MVKAEKHTLLMASSYGRVTVTRENHVAVRQSLPAMRLKNGGYVSIEPQTVLHALRTEFGAKYRARLPECTLSTQDSNEETAQLRTLYRKLRGVIPTLSQRKSEKVSSLDVVLGAIDYIRDLHEMLARTLPADMQDIDTVTTSASSNMPNVYNRVPFKDIENLHSDVSSLMDVMSDNDLPIN